MKRLVWGGVLALALAGSAHAENRLGSRIEQRRDTAIEQARPDAIRAAHRMAGCLYLKNQGKAKQALALTDRNAAEKGLERLDSRTTCINLSVGSEFADSQRITYSPEILRGLLAEAALRQDYNGTKLDPLPRQQVYERPWFAATGRPFAIDEMAACVADTDPAGIRSLLATPAETPEERKAFSALMPSLGPCLAQGAKMDADRHSLRAALAEALYQRAAAPMVTRASR